MLVVMGCDMYYVKAYVRKWPFTAPTVRYKVMLEYEYWDDPSYGNGGGYYRKAIMTVCAVASEVEATTMVEELNKYDCTRS